MPRFSLQRFSLVLFILSLLAPACSTAHSIPLDQTTRARTISAPSENRPVAVIVKAQKANLRNQPSKTGTLIATVNKDDLLALTDSTPAGAWYHVKDKNGVEGWIHGNTIALLQTTDGGATTAADATAAASTTATSSPATANTATTPTATSAATTSSTATSTAATSTDQPHRPSPTVSGKSYVNADGVRVPSPRFSDTKPEGATARCRDGSYSFSLHRSGTCSHHGGVAEWF